MGDTEPEREHQSCKKKNREQNEKRYSMEAHKLFSNIVIHNVIQIQMAFALCFLIKFVLMYVEVLYL